MEETTGKVISNGIAEDIVGGFLGCDIAALARGDKDELALVFVNDGYVERLMRTGLTSQSGRCEAQKRLIRMASFGDARAAGGLVHTGGLAGTLSY